MGDTHSSDTIADDRAVEADDEADVDSSALSGETTGNLSQGDFEREVTELLAQSRWAAAVTSYRKHAARTFGGLSGMIQDWHGVGSRSVEDDIHAMLDLYCRHLQAKVIDQNRSSAAQMVPAGGAVASDDDVVSHHQRCLFVMTLTDVDMSNNCLKLKEASLQLSDTVKQMEQALAKQRHSMVEQASLLLAAQQQQQVQQQQQQQQQHQHQQKDSQQQSLDQPEKQAVCSSPSKVGGDQPPTQQTQQATTGDNEETISQSQQAK